MSKSEIYGHLATGRAKAAVIGVFWSAINTAFPFALGLLVFVLTSRVLNPEQFGLVALAASVAAFATALAPGAFAGALIQRTKIDELHINTIFWLCAGSGAALTIVTVLFAPLIARLLQQDDIVLLIQVFAFKILFDLVGMVPNSLIVRQMNFRLVAVRTVVASIISAIACLALLYTGFGLWALVASQLTTSFITMAAALWTSGFRPKFLFASSSLRELSRYGLFATGTQMLGTMNIDQLMLGSMASPVALGLYNFARRLLAMINSVLTGTLATVTHTLFASLQEEKSKVREAFALSTFLSLGVSCPIFLGLAWLAPDLIPFVFSETWNAAVIPVQALCSVGVLASVGLVQSSLISSQGRTDWWFYYQAAQQALTFGIIAILHPYGIDVVVLCIAAKTWLLWPISVVMAARLIDARPVQTLTAAMPAILASAAMLSVLWMLTDHLASLNVLQRLIAQVAIGAVVYTTVAGALAFDRVRQIAKIIRPAKEL